jgi:hypothetical protein
MRKVDIVCDVCGYIHKVDEEKLNVKGTDWEYLCIPKPQHCERCKCLTRHSLLKEAVEKVSFT